MSSTQPPAPPIPALDIDLVEAFGVRLVQENSAPGGSDDGLDYFYAACESLAEVVSLHRNDDVTDTTHAKFAEWVGRDPWGVWYACDGDIRWNFDSLLTELGMDAEAAAWSQWIEDRTDETV